MKTIILQDNQVTVLVSNHRSRKSSTSSDFKVKDTADLTPDLTQAGNLQLNKSKKKEFKKMKKKRKQSGMIPNDHFNFYQNLSTGSSIDRPVNPFRTRDFVCYNPGNLTILLKV